MPAIATRPAPPARYAHPLDQRWTLTLAPGVELQTVFVANLQQWRLLAGDGVVTVRAFLDGASTLAEALSATETLWNERFASPPAHPARARTIAG